MNSNYKILFSERLNKPLLLLEYSVDKQNIFNQFIDNGEEFTPEVVRKSLGETAQGILTKASIKKGKISAKKPQGK